jgi:DNA polymerase-3 subunit alpha
MSSLDWKSVIPDLSALTEDELYFLYQLERGWNKKLSALIARSPEQEKIYWDRLKEEVLVILKMKFPSYFLIVQDMLLWCDTNKIRRGPGRGSAA